MPYSLWKPQQSEVQWIYYNGQVVGFLYPPINGHPQWELVPRLGSEALLPDRRDEYAARLFDTEADALAFLGIQPEAVAA